MATTFVRSVYTSWEVGAVDDKSFICSLVAVVLLCVLDVVTTLGALSISKPSCRLYEANPVVRELLSTSPTTWVAAKVIGGCVIGVCLYLVWRIARANGLRVMQAVCLAAVMVLLVWGLITVINNIVLSLLCVFSP